VSLRGGGEGDRERAAELLEVDVVGAALSSCRSETSGHSSSSLLICVVTYEAVSSRVGDVERHAAPQAVGLSTVVEADVGARADDPDRVLDRLHRVLPTLVLDIDAEEHEQPSVTDLPFLVDGEHPIDQSTDLHPAVGGSLTQAVVNQGLCDLQLRSELQLIRHGNLQLRAAIV
jgi:hypothetical protein